MSYETVVHSTLGHIQVQLLNFLSFLIRTVHHPSHLKPVSASSETRHDHDTHHETDIQNDPRTTASPICSETASACKKTSPLASHLRSTHPVEPSQRSWHERSAAGMSTGKVHKLVQLSHLNLSFLSSNIL